MFDIGAIHAQIPSNIQPIYHLCRQRAWRARNKDKHNLDKIIQRSHERMWNSLDQNVRRESWQDELQQKDEYIAFLDQHIQFLNRECEALEAEIAWLKLEQGWKEEHMANQDAEIARLNALLNPTRPRRSR